MRNSQFWRKHFGYSVKKTTENETEEPPATTTETKDAAPEDPQHDLIEANAPLKFKDYLEDKQLEIMGSQEDN